ncbi:MAG: type II toxin-antitoxin system RelE/ParE family toxin [Firmicutes bacterium]|nr:type II toxin-antitoxin system RelE/ParE family toxin [Bacillota bacterium]
MKDKHELVITDAAALDLVGTVEFIAQSSAERANQYHDDVLAKITLLEIEPLLGRPHTEKRLKRLGYRELVMLSHIAHYIIDEEKRQVNVIRVLHGTMDQARHLKMLK